MHTTTIVSILSALSLTAAVEIDGLLSEGCTGERLWRYVVDTYDNCIDVTKYRTEGSVAVGDFNAGQTVIFFSDGNCNNQIYQADSPVCYTDPDNDVGGIQVAQAISRAQEFEA